jgi:hypothetical protein
MVVMGTYSPMIEVLIELYKMRILRQDATFAVLNDRLPNTNVKDALEKSLDLGSVDREFFGAGRQSVRYVISPGSLRFVQQLCIDEGIIGVTEKILI